MKGFCPLASGSRGNCIYIGNESTKLLIDAGISGKATKDRLATIGVDLEEIDAILITHDHTDHIQGLKQLAIKRKIPVFANQETAKGIVEIFQDCPKFKIFSTGETFEFGGFEIYPFNVPHDTLDPVGFTIKTEGIKLGFCTDLGFVTELVRSSLRGCDYLYIEANHQPELVYESKRRPKIYKERVLSRTGHLSNEACANLLCDIANTIKHIHLAHLSSECNSPELAMNVIQKILDQRGMTLDMCIAGQFHVSKAIYF